MRKLTLLLTVLAVTGMLTASARGERGDRDGRKGPDEARQARSESHSRSESRSESGHKCERSERYENSAEGAEAVREKMRKWQKRHAELKELHQDSVRALGKDNEATKAIAKQLREHMKARMELQKQLRKRAAAGEKARHHAGEMGCPMMMSMRLEISSDQRKQIKHIMLDARNEIVQEVLTPKQREQLNQARRQRRQDRRPGSERPREGERRWDREDHERRSEKPARRTERSSEGKRARDGRGRGESKRPCCRRGME
ncbi:MAG: hypothetical protein ACOC9S_03005 [Planctomycetota bacterium]